MSDPQLPPEVLFHRYFQTEIPPHLRSKYRGKFDLERLEPEGDRRYLANFQHTMNQRLADAAVGRGQADREVFHFDYVDCDEDQALAFKYCGYSFIAISIGFVRSISSLSQRLGKSREILACLGLPEAIADSLAGLIFRTQLLFVATHEVNHHFFRHVEPSADQGDMYLEFSEEAKRASLNCQAIEIYVDSYAVFVMLNFLLVSHRARTIEILRIGSLPDQPQDLLLLQLFVLALTANFLSRAPRDLNEETVYASSHPHPASRMHYVLFTARQWWLIYKPHLSELMSPARYSQLQVAIAAQVWPDAAGVSDWNRQAAFLKSPAGVEYDGALFASIIEHNASTGPESYFAQAGKAGGINP